MRWSRFGIVALAGAAGLAAAVAGCGASEPTTAEAAAADTAGTVCTMLRRWNNDLTETINATAQSITDADDPDTSVDALVAGFDEMIDAAGAHRVEVDDLDLPSVPERDTLLADLAAGADESIAVLQDERADAADLPPIEVSDQPGALGGAFVGVERATSVIEPPVGTYDEVLREAFAADDGCEHVIQPF
jgi:hypothetical protein